MSQSLSLTATPTPISISPLPKFDRDFTSSQSSSVDIAASSRASHRPLSSGVANDKKHTAGADSSQGAKTPANTIFRTPPDMTSSLATSLQGLTNGVGAALFRPGAPFAAAYTPPAHAYSSLLQSSSMLASQLQNGTLLMSLER